MSERREPRLRFRRHPAVRLRRESWGGLAFHRDRGDLLELDAEGFDAVAALARARTLADLREHLRARGHPARGPGWRLLPYPLSSILTSPTCLPIPCLEAHPAPHGLRAPILCTGR